MIAVAFGSATSTGLALGAVPARRAHLEAFVCHRARRASRRVVSITAVMRPLPGTAAMRMRFELISDAGGHLAQVHGGDLGTWISPQPPTLGQDPGDVWIVRHPVYGLKAPADYRFRVSFRWLDFRHRVLATATRVSGVCWQPVHGRRGYTG